MEDVFEFKCRIKQDKKNSKINKYSNKEQTIQIFMCNRITL